MWKRIAEIAKRIAIMLVLLFVLAGAGPEVPAVQVAGHHGRYIRGTMSWTSTAKVDTGMLAVRERIELAYPLSAEARLVRSKPAGFEAVRADDGTIRAVALGPDTPVRSTVELTWRQPLAAPAKLRPPLFAGRVIQRVTLDGAHYQASQSAVALFPGYRAQEGVSEEQIDWCERELGEVSESTGVPIFVRPDGEFFAAGALAGELVSDQAHRRDRLLMLGGGFGLLFVVCLAGYHWLAGRARHEEADAFLRGLG